ncbi:MAG: hypothetical protein IPP58_14045 [Holophagaceae bacterium]|uniref:Uncharacterized protein n=1 Tax=Candidatus Geothrix skivensis TaxID=2954439 RepID=A0A9D7SH48_9BACT|nr:hypothetical protein [Candidatus Geothrix skivensis]
MARFSPVFLTLALAAGALAAGDYDSLFGAIKKSWPQYQSVAVVCDTNGSKAALASLTSSAGGMKLLVVDVKGPQDMGKAIAALTNRKPDVVILLSGDHIAGDGSSAAGFLIKRMAEIKIPTAAITEAGAKQGAVLAIGQGTGGKLMSNAKVAAVAGLAVPAGATSI